MNNPHHWTYVASRDLHRRDRALLARRERERLANARDEERKIARFWRDNGQVNTVDCVVTWINSTFGASLVDLPQGDKNEAEHCPIANALWSLGQFGDVQVNGSTIVVVEADCPDSVVSVDDYDDDGYWIGTRWIDQDTGEEFEWTREIKAPACVLTFVVKFDDGAMPEYATPTPVYDPSYCDCPDCN